MKKLLKINSNLALPVCFALALLLSACAGQQLEVEPIAKSENPQELINKLENEIALARRNQVTVLAPAWFGEAESSLNNAKQALDQGDELVKIFDHVATGRAQLRRAEEIAKIAQTT